MQSQTEQLLATLESITEGIHYSSKDLHSIKPCVAIANAYFPGFNQLNI